MTITDKEMGEPRRSAPLELTDAMYLAAGACLVMAQLENGEASKARFRAAADILMQRRSDFLQGTECPGSPNPTEERGGE